MMAGRREARINRRTRPVNLHARAYLREIAGSIPARAQPTVHDVGYIASARGFSDTSPEILTAGVTAKEFARAIFSAVMIIARLRSKPANERIAESIRSSSLPLPETCPS